MPINQSLLSALISRYWEKKWPEIYKKMQAEWATATKLPAIKKSLDTKKKTK